MFKSFQCVFVYILFVLWGTICIKVCIMTYHPLIQSAGASSVQATLGMSIFIPFLIGQVKACIVPLSPTNCKCWCQRSTSYITHVDFDFVPFLSCANLGSWRHHCIKQKSKVVASIHPWFIWASPIVSNLMLSEVYTDRMQCMHGWLVNFIIPPLSSLTNAKFLINQQSVDPICYAL